MFVVRRKIGGKKANYMFSYVMYGDIERNQLHERADLLTSLEDGTLAAAARK